MAIEPAPERQDVVQYRTPNTRDSLFFKIHQAAGKERTAVPDYGAAYPTKAGEAQFPNHRLCYIEQAVDGKGLFEKWWYVEDLTSQETWNGDWSWPYAGNPMYPRVTRRYTLRREEGESGIELGTPDPGGAVDGMAVTLADGTPVTLADGTPVVMASLGTPILVAQSERFLEGTIGSLFVDTTRVFDIIPGTDDVTPGSGAGQTESAYEISYPFAGHEYVQLVWTITLPRLIAEGLKTFQGGTNPNTMTPCPIPGYTNLLMVDEKITASSEENQTSKVVRTFRGNLTGNAFPSAVGTVSGERRHPGNFPPDKFVSNILEYSVTVDDIRVTIDNIIPPDTLAEAVSGGYTLVSESFDPESWLVGKRKLTFAAPIIKTLRGEQWDSVLETNVPYTVEALPWENGTIYRENDAGVAAAETVTGARNLVAVPGTEITISPYNAKWAIVTKETPVPSTISIDGSTIGGVSGALVASGNAVVSYYVSHPYYWPPVLPLANVVYEAYVDTSTGKSSFLWDYKFSKDAWKGMCKARVQIAYCITNPISNGEQLPTQHLAPMAINFSGRIANFDIPACLHPRIPETGTFSDGSAILSKVWEATQLYGPLSPGGSDQTDWPDSLCIEFDVKPHKGGFAVTRMDVYKPY